MDFVRQCTLILMEWAKVKAAEDAAEAHRTGIDCACDEHEKERLNAAEAERLRVEKEQAEAAAAEMARI